MFVVTGGGSGIGKALAQALAIREKQVLIVGRNQHHLAETAASSPLINYLCADVSTQEGRQRIVAHLQPTAQLDGLIHSAGVIEPIVAVTAIDEAAWRDVMATNLDAPLFLSQQLKDKLDNARVLNIGSGAAYSPMIGWSAYCVSKAALAMLTRCWQLETTIAIASVMPGIIDTNMQAQIRHANHMDEETQEFFKQLQHNKQLLNPATVAIFLCWLLLDIDKEHYVSREWDIYDSTHHQAWLVPPHRVLVLE